MPKIVGRWVDTFLCFLERTDFHKLKNFYLSGSSKNITGNSTSRYCFVTFHTFAEYSTCMGKTSGNQVSMPLYTIVKIDCQ